MSHRHAFPLANSDSRGRPSALSSPATSTNSVLSSSSGSQGLESKLDTAIDVDQSNFPERFATEKPDLLLSKRTIRSLTARAEQWTGAQAEEQWMRRILTAGGRTAKEAEGDMCEGLSVFSSSSSSSAQSSVSPGTIPPGKRSLFLQRERHGQLDCSRPQGAVERGIQGHQVCDGKPSQCGKQHADTGDTDGALAGQKRERSSFESDCNQATSSSLKKSRKVGKGQDRQPLQYVHGEFVQAKWNDGVYYNALIVKRVMENKHEFKQCVVEWLDPDGHP